MRLLTLVVALLATTAYADPITQTVTENNTLTIAPSQWLGEAPHIVVFGTANGYEFEMEYLDLHAEGIATVEAKREYLPNGDSLRYADFEFGMEAIIAGVEKKFELEFENYNFNSQTLPATYALQSEEFPKGALSNLEFEFEWETAGKSVNEEIVQWQGNLTLELDTAHGSAEPKGDGLIGGFIEANKGTDKLAISFTVEVNEYEIDD